MNSELATLQIRIESLEASVAAKRLGKLEQQGRKAERATDGLTKSFGRLVAPIAAVVSVTAGLQKLVNVTREFEVLNAQLKTATGSAENAAIAFTHIQDFATQTPYDLQQATEAFTKLVNFGLTPSQEAMVSYGDTASAMGGDLIQMVEAVADAATGEFERLKEFGIKSKNQGDTIAFTFRGITTEVKNNAEAIEGYLIGLGQNNFAGAMTERMNTLDGAMSNLGDEWDKLWLNISQQGAGEAIEDSVRLGIGALEELNDMMASGELTAYLQAIVGKFDAFGTDIVDTIDIVTNLATKAFGQWGEESTEVAKFVSDNVDTNLSNMPENIRALVQLMAIEFAALIDYGQAYGKAFAQVIGVELAALVDKAGIYGKEIGDRMTFWDGDTYDYEAELKRASTTAREMTNGFFEEAERQAEITKQARIDSIEAVIDEREAGIKSFNDQKNAGKELRAEYELLQAEREKATDALAGFSVGGKGGDDGEAEAQDQQLERLRQSLMSEEELIIQSYDRRAAIILEKTEKDSVDQYDLQSRLNRETATALLEEYIENTDTTELSLEQIETEFAARIDLLIEKYGEETDLIIALEQHKADVIAELKRDARNIELTEEQKHQKAIERWQKLSFKEQTAAYTSMLANNLSSFKDSSRAMFEIHKYASIGETLSSAYYNATRAYSDFGGGIQGVIASGVIGASGIANAMRIAGTQFGSSATGAPSTPSVTSGSGSSLTPEPQFETNFNNNKEPGRTININFPNATVLGGQMNQFVDDMMDAMSERMQDGDRILFNADSRQAQELVA